MALGISEYLQRLLQSVTNYYTATYSTATDLYEILRMYSHELASGSTAIETTRNNVFIVSCENSKLFDNFGTHFNQLKYFNQNYDEDRYIDVSGSYRKVPTPVKYSDSSYSFLPWSLVSSSPYSLTLDTSPSQNGTPIVHTTVYAGDRLFGTCFLQPSDSYAARLVEYDIGEGTWKWYRTELGITPSWLTMVDHPAIGMPALPPFGITSYTPYLGQGRYGDESLYYFDYIVKAIIPLGVSQVNLVAVKPDLSAEGPTAQSNPTYTSNLFYFDPSQVSNGNITYTDSAVLHNKIYTSVAVQQGDPTVFTDTELEAPDTTHDWPFLFEFDPSTNTLSELGLANVSGLETIDWEVHALTNYNSGIHIVMSGSSGVQRMVRYDGIEIDIGLTSPSNGATEKTKGIAAYQNELYALVWDVTSYEVKKYNKSTDSWSVHTSYTYPVFKLYVTDDTLLLSTARGYIYYLDTSDDTFKEHYQINVSGNRGLKQFEKVNSTIYGMLPHAENAWYSTGYDQTVTTTYVAAGGAVSGDIQNFASIPGYRKQLDFMLDSAVHGGSIHGINRAVNAFTLINPDIREIYGLPRWKLKQVDSSITQISPTIWQFTPSPSWRRNLYQGAHITLTSGSAPTDKAVAGYVVLLNNHNSVTVGPIYDNDLLFDFERAQ